MFPAALVRNGFTTITSNFIVPAAGANVTASVGNSLLLSCWIKSCPRRNSAFSGRPDFQPDIGFSDIPELSPAMWLLARQSAWVRLLPLLMGLPD